MNVYHTLDKLPLLKQAVVTGGTFDGVHKGHQAILHQVALRAKEKNVPSVVFTFWPHPVTILQPNLAIKRLQTLEEKLHHILLCGIEHVWVIPFSTDFSTISYQTFCERMASYFSPSLWVMGHDTHFGKNREGNYDTLLPLAKQFNFNVESVAVERVEDEVVSSTRIRQAIANGNVAQANRYLGYAYSIQADVVKGDQVGRTLGFPTANLHVLDEKLLPDFGVYAVKVKVKEKDYMGMLNYGIRPTVDGKKEQMEVHLLSFDENIYDENVQISFYKKIRAEKKFDSIEALKNQLTEDEKTVRAFFASSRD